MIALCTCYDVNLPRLVILIWRQLIALPIADKVGYGTRFGMCNRATDSQPWPANLALRTLNCPIRAE